MCPTQPLPNPMPRDPSAYQTSVGQDPLRVRWFGKAWVYLPDGTPLLAFCSGPCVDRAFAEEAARMYVKDLTLS